MDAEAGRVSGLVRSERVFCPNVSTRCIAKSPPWWDRAFVDIPLLAGGEYQHHHV